MPVQKSRYPAHYALFLIAYYVTNSVYQGFMSLYYTNIGFTSAQTGTIFAAVALVSVFTQPFWGTCGDRMKVRNVLLRLLALAAGLLMLCFELTEKFVPLLLLGCMFIVSFDGFDFATNFTAALSCMSNVGPGLGRISPAGFGLGMAYEHEP